MSTQELTRTSSTLTSIRWHRPLLWIGAAMVPLVIVCIIGMAVDPRTLGGVGVWEKPLKFALSTIIYAVTWSWLIGQLDRFRRVAWLAGTISAVMLAIELVIITGAAAGGVTSHFNVSSPLATVLWSVMGASITTLWIATFVVSVILFRNGLGDPARTLAIRGGAVIALVGMGLAFLMTGPTADQLNDFQGIAGAHAVGLADGGPGLPILGWSTIGGDLRIPHFVGMHALQAIPLFLIALEFASRRIHRLRSSEVRRGLVAIAIAAYSAFLAVLTVQAIMGQSIVRPDATVIATSITIVVLAIGSGLAVFLRSGTSSGATARAYTDNDSPGSSTVNSLPH